MSNSPNIHLKISPNAKGQFLFIIIFDKICHFSKKKRKEKVCFLNENSMKLATLWGENSPRISDITKLKRPPMTKEPLYLLLFNLL